MATYFRARIPATALLPDAAAHLAPNQPVPLYTVDLCFQATSTVAYFQGMRYPLAATMLEALIYEGYIKLASLRGKAQPQIAPSTVAESPEAHVPSGQTTHGVAPTQEAPAPSWVTPPGRGESDPLLRALAKQKQLALMRKLEQDWYPVGSDLRLQMHTMTPYQRNKTINRLIMWEEVMIKVKHPASEPVSAQSLSLSKYRLRQAKGEQKLKELPKKQYPSHTTNRRHRPQRPQRATARRVTEPVEVGSPNRGFCATLLLTDKQSFNAQFSGSPATSGNPEPFAGGGSGLGPTTQQSTHKAAMLHIPAHPSGP